MNMRYVLDACALIAYYNKEEGFDKVKKVTICPMVRIRN
jgi:PIN domain nuclease of toxin-antitoxin system